MDGNLAARIIAGLSALGLLAAILAAALVPRLQLRGWSKLLCYGSSAAIILCFGLLLTGMIWGLASNWASPAKTAMIFGFFMTVPAFAGSVVLTVAGFGGAGPARGYFIGFGIAGILVFALPALVMTIMAGPGRP